MEPHVPPFITIAANTRGESNPNSIHRHLLDAYLQAPIFHRMMRDLDGHHLQGEKSSDLLGRSDVETGKSATLRRLIFFVPTVDGRNPAPPRMMVIPLFLRF